MLPFLAILAKFLRNVPLFGQKSRFFRDIVPLFVFDGLVSIIYITEWAPQLSVMGHRSVSMAVLHGGSNGLHEALFNEIPPIVLPVDGDQFANAGRIISVVEESVKLSKRCG